MPAGWPLRSARQLLDDLRNPTLNPTFRGGSRFGGGRYRWDEPKHAPNRRTFFVDADRRVVALHLLRHVTRQRPPNDRVDVREPDKVLTADVFRRDLTVESGPR